MAPGLAMPSSRAAILTPSPIRSPSLSSTTSPRWMPTRNSMRRSGGRPALRSTMPFCNSMAQRTASTTLRNSTSAPSPVRLTTRPLCTAIVGSTRSLRSARSRASVRSSSSAGQPAVADNIRRKDRREFPGLGHERVPSCCPARRSEEYHASMLNSVTQFGCSERPGTVALFTPSGLVRCPLFGGYQHQSRHQVAIAEVRT